MICIGAAIDARRAAAPPTRAGFTLLEVVLSSTVISIVMIATASVMVLASRALPQKASATTLTVDTSQALQQIVRELQHAVHITEQTATAVTFTVADRDGDGSPESIRYVWPDAPGSPLRRSHNGGPAVTVIADVQSLTLTYEIKTTVEAYPGSDVESSEQLLASHYSNKRQVGRAVTADRWIGQYIRPAIETGAVGWRATKVTVAGRIDDGVESQSLVQLRVPDANKKPTDTVLQEKVLSEWYMAWSYVWESVNFADTARLAPGEAVCLVIRHDSGLAAGAFLYEDDAGSGLLTTGNAGGNWDYNGGDALLYYLYGRVIWPGTPKTATRQFVTAVSLGLTVNATEKVAAETTVCTINAPEMLSSVWVLDFDADPTAIDATDDGDQDWVVRDGGSFDVGSLAGGVWRAAATLDTYPNDDFAELTTVDVRFRNTTRGGNGAVFWINADWSDGKAAPIFAYLQLQSDGTQTLTVYGKTSSAASFVMATAPGLPAGFVDLRLLIDPESNTVNVKVNGIGRGTYNYGTYVPLDDDRFASIFADGSSAQFDSIRIRVGGSGS